MSEKNYEYISRWGDKRLETIEPDVKRFFKTEFNLSDADLVTGQYKNNNSVKLPENKLRSENIEALKNLVGQDNLLLGDYDRAYHSYGKFYSDLLNLRSGKVEHPTDVVITPDNTKQIEDIVQYCDEHGIAIIPFGGGTSVTRALEAPKGGVTLNLSKKFNKVIQLNETNKSITVQSGILGPDLEKFLNSKGYTCGHFPQSFEYTTAGGWIAARGAGQNSTGYGTAADILLALEVVCPVGTFSTKDYPYHAQGWNLNEVICGSEGTLGVITELTLKIFKHNPSDRTQGSMIFKTFESGVHAMRDMAQGEFGLPHIFRLSDGPETDYGFRIKGVDKTYKNKVLNMLKYPQGERSVMYYTVDGEKDYNRLVQKKMKRIAKKHGAFLAGKEAIKKWLDMRFHSSYLRDTYFEHGMMIDTMETAVNWENLIPLWKAAHAYAKKFPNLFVMSHISHVYPNGANLYVIFQGPIKKGQEMESFYKFQKGMLQVFNDNGGSLSHHHGVGRMSAHLMPQQYGETGMKLLNGIKRAFDPNGIMNPGGTLGLDA